MADVKAKLNYARISPQKVRMVAAVIRGKSLDDAKDNLKFISKASAPIFTKLLKSAEANAKNTFSLKPEQLFIKEIRVDGGPTLKRFMPRAFGRAAPIRKRTSHITVILGEK